MPAKDKFHDAVKTALIKEQWTITHDPLNVKFGDYDQVQIDLGAEQVLGAEKDNQKIAVEIKSFISASSLTDFHLAIGQFLNYRVALKVSDPERKLYLAIPEEAYTNFFKKEFAHMVIAEYQLEIIVYDIENEVIVTWKI